MSPVSANNHNLRSAKRIVASILTITFLFQSTISYALSPDLRLMRSEFKDRYLARHALEKHQLINEYISSKIPPEGITQLQCRPDKIPVKVKGRTVKKNALIVAIPGLLDKTGEFAHVGLGTQNGKPVIYLDEECFARIFVDKRFYYNEDVLQYYKAEIAEWEGKRRSLGLTYGQMKEWIESDPGAGRIAKRLVRNNRSLERLYAQLSIPRNRLDGDLAAKENWYQAYISAMDADTPPAALTPEAEDATLDELMAAAEARRKRRSPSGKKFSPEDYARVEKQYDTFGKLTDKIDETREALVQGLARSSRRITAAHIRQFNKSLYLSQQESLTTVLAGRFPLEPYRVNRTEVSDLKKRQVAEFENDPYIRKQMAEFVEWINAPKGSRPDPRTYPNIGQFIIDKRPWGLDWDNDEIHCAMAFWLFHQVIHPFSDRNSRTGWEFMNIMRQRAGLAPIEFPTDDENHQLYYETFDPDQKPDKFLALFADLKATDKRKQRKSPSGAGHEVQFYSAEDLKGLRTRLE
ncbi:hypothetical protein ACFL42_02570, partial [Candidatus Omnitrophota bacterium]